MKHLLSIALLLPLFILAQEGVQFKEGLTWKQILQKAKAENKYIFVDCYATWCGPCKWMDSAVFSLGEVGKFYNENFISVKVQMDTSKADVDYIKGWYADAAMLRNRYKIDAFPSYLFFSPNGRVLHKEIGAKGVNEFMAIGHDALDVNKQYYVLLEKYRRRKLDTSFMRDLAFKAKDIDGDELARKIANDYLNSIPANNLFTRDNIRLMAELTKSSKDKGFALFRDSAKRIQEADERVNGSISKGIVLNIIYNDEIKPYRNTKNGKADWATIQANLRKYGLLGEEALTAYTPGIVFKTEIEPALNLNSAWSNILPLIQAQRLGKNAEFVVGSTVVFYLNAIAISHTEKSCENLVLAASYYADSFPGFVTGHALNDWAWVLFEHSNEVEELRKALAWSKRSIELEPDFPEHLDTYANLLYKLGRVEEAIACQEKAVQLEEAKEYYRPVFRQNLVKMQNGEKTWPDK